MGMGGGVFWGHTDTHDVEEAAGAAAAPRSPFRFPFQEVTKKLNDSRSLAAPRKRAVPNAELTKP